MTSIFCFLVFLFSNNNNNKKSVSICSRCSAVPRIIQVCLFSGLGVHIDPKLRIPGSRKNTILLSCIPLTPSPLPWKNAGGIERGESEKGFEAMDFFCCYCCCGFLLFVVRVFEDAWIIGLAEASSEDLL